MGQPRLCQYSMPLKIMFPRRLLIPLPHINFTPRLTCDILAFKCRQQSQPMTLAIITSAPSHHNHHQATTLLTIITHPTISKISRLSWHFLHVIYMHRCHCSVKIKRCNEAPERNVVSLGSDVNKHGRTSHFLASLSCEAIPHFWFTGN